MSTGDPTVFAKLMEAYKAKKGVYEENSKRTNKESRT